MGMNGLHAVKFFSKKGEHIQFNATRPYVLLLSSQDLVSPLPMLEDF